MRVPVTAAKPSDNIQEADKPSDGKQAALRDETKLTRYEIIPEVALENYRRLIVNNERSTKFVVTCIELARFSDPDGNTLAHMSVSAWKSAAELVLENYRDAKADKIIEIEDPRVLVPLLRNNLGVSVEQKARMMMGFELRTDLKIA